VHKRSSAAIPEAADWRCRWFSGRGRIWSCSAESGPPPRTPTPVRRRIIVVSRGQDLRGRRWDESLAARARARATSPSPRLRVPGQSRSVSNYVYHSTLELSRHARHTRSWSLIRSAEGRGGGSGGGSWWRCCGAWRGACWWRLALTIKWASMERRTKQSCSRGASAINPPRGRVATWRGLRALPADRALAGEVLGASFSALTRQKPLSTGRSSAVALSTSSRSRRPRSRPRAPVWPRPTGAPIWPVPPGAPSSGRVPPGGGRFARGRPCQAGGPVLAALSWRALSWRPCPGGGGVSCEWLSIVHAPARCPTADIGELYYTAVKICILLPVFCVGLMAHGC